jgi:hypothetical protein
MYWIYVYYDLCLEVFLITIQAQTPKVCIPSRFYRWHAADRMHIWLLLI